MSNHEMQEAASGDTEHDIKMGEAYKRLKNNPDFKVLIQDGYLEQKVLASVSLLAVPAIAEQGGRSGVMEDLIAASNLQYYLQVVEQFYQAAVDPVLTDQEQEEVAAQMAEGAH